MVINTQKIGVIKKKNMKMLEKSNNKKIKYIYAYVISLSLCITV